MKFIREIDINNDGSPDLEISYKLDPVVAAWIGRSVSIVIVLWIIALAFYYAALYTVDIASRASSFLWKHSTTILALGWGGLVLLMLALGLTGALVANANAIPRLLRLLRLSATVLVWLALATASLIGVGLVISAAADGANSWGNFWNVAAPMSLFAIALAAILYFVPAWRLLLFWCGGFLSALYLCIALVAGLSTSSRPKAPPAISSPGSSWASDLNRAPVVAPAELIEMIALAEFNGESLSLAQLTTLDAETAKLLADFKGESLSLGGLTTIDTATAKLLAQFKCESLSLHGLTTLDENVAKTLAEFKGTWLHLGGLSAIDASTVRALANYKGKYLTLLSLTEIDDEAAAALRANRKIILPDNVKRK